MAPPAKSAIFLVLTIDPGAEQQVGELLGDVSGLVRSVGFRLPEGELSCVVGIGFFAWSRLFTAPRPSQLHPFRALHGERHTAPSTPGDLLIHLRSSQMDLCFELATQLMARLRGLATVVDETHGFRSFDERDLLGFVDGTESPDGPAAVKAALIGEGEPYSGGSYVIVQKYVHAIERWDALTVEEQELAIGRHKSSNIELPDAAKPANSHLALNVIEDDDGNELQIVRDNMPFGEVGTSTFGTYFIGYAADPRVTERMLTNMFIGDPPGNHDRILDFSTARTGGLFFVPDADFLDDPPVRVGTDA
ncbi:MAG: Dyp-type peroxidase [Propionibacteriaceae bacterium]